MARMDKSIRFDERGPGWWLAFSILTGGVPWSSSIQGRHMKTGQLAAIKIMDVTEVSAHVVARYTFNFSFFWERTRKKKYGWKWRFFER